MTTPTESQREPECNMCKSGICSMHAPKEHSYKLGVHQDDCPNCGGCEAGRNLIPNNEEIEEPFPPHTDENRELLRNWQNIMMSRWGLNGEHYQFDPENRPKPYQIKDLIIALLEAKDAECAEKIEEAREDTGNWWNDQIDDMIAAAVREERERCLKIVSRIQCPCESKCSHFNYVRNAASEKILNPEGPA